MNVVEGGGLCSLLSGMWQRPSDPPARLNSASSLLHVENIRLTRRTNFKNAVWRNQDMLSGIWEHFYLNEQKSSLTLFQKKVLFLVVNTSQRNKHKATPLRSTFDKLVWFFKFCFTPFSFLKIAIQQLRRPHLISNVSLAWLKSFFFFFPNSLKL